MKLLTADFETMYDSEYSLSKLSTESYIRDPRFEVIGASLAEGMEEPRWYAAPDLREQLTRVNWSDTALLCWNTAFDGAILGWKYGFYPALYLDAMGMARACGVAYRGASLHSVTELLGVGVKGTYVVNAKGKRFADFTAQELAEYGRYCCQDTWLTREVYLKLKDKFVVSEAQTQDLMLRMFTQPLLRFDTTALRAYYEEVKLAKATALTHAAERIGITEAELLPRLMSNPQLAVLLEQLGVDPPQKLSPTTGNLTFAFAKTDPEFVELQEHPDPCVAAVVGTRLGVKTTIEETRSAAFLDLATRGAWPVQYNYWAAVSSRFTGAGGVNPQNLKRGGRLRDAVVAPPGHVLVVGDLRQIEARMVNYVAGQDSIVERFRAYDEGHGADIYCLAASGIYGRIITPEETRERTVGKIQELSCGYMASGKAYKKMLFNQTGRILPLPECEKVVAAYRRTHPKVQDLWYQGDEVLRAMCRGNTFTFGRHGVLRGDNPSEGIGLPNGMYIRLPGLVQVASPQGQIKYVYMHKKTTYEIYGGQLVADCIQALARIVMCEAMIRVATRFRVCMMTHDELVLVVPAAQAEEAKELLRTEMTRELSWAPGLPLACSVGAGVTYGGAKT